MHNLSLHFAIIKIWHVFCFAQATHTLTRVFMCVDYSVCKAFKQVFLYDCPCGLCTVKHGWLTHFILNDLFWHIYWKSPFSISGVLGYVSQDIFVGKWLNN